MFIKIRSRFITLKRLRKKLYKIREEEDILFVHGIGKRKSVLQKSVETLEHYIDKLKEYTHKLYVCGKRNGYSRTDTLTLIPFLKDMKSYLAINYRNIITGSEYESEENYLFIEENGQLAFIKPQNYEFSKTRKFKNDISRRENMDCDCGRILINARTAGR